MQTYGIYMAKAVTGNYLTICFNCFFPSVVLNKSALKNTNRIIKNLTHQLFLFPRFHRRFVFLELIAPIRVDLLIVGALVRRSASGNGNGKTKNESNNVNKLLYHPMPCCRNVDSVSNIQTFAAHKFAVFFVCCCCCVVCLLVCESVDFVHPCHLPVRIDRDAVAAQQWTAQNAIVTAAIALVDSDYDQATFGGLNVLDRTVFDFLAVSQQKKRVESFTELMRYSDCFGLKSKIHEEWI